MARRKTATLQTIAETAGVSVSTVSRILNSPEFATQETRDRVLKAVESAGYTQLHRADPPSLTLPSNHNGASNLKTIVLLAPEKVLGGLDARDWIYSDIVPTIQRCAKQNGFRLILSSYGQKDDWNPAAITANHICGVLWMAHDCEDLLARISKVVPVVVINDDSLWPPQTSVLANNRTVIFQAVQHLVELGHENIAYFDVDERPAEQSIHCRERLAAYHEAVLYFKTKIDPALCIRERFGMNEHPQAVAKAFDQMLANKPRASALISPLQYSIQFLKEARKRSVAVPEKLSIVAIDNATAAECVDPPLTTIDCMLGRCAEVAIELLIEAKTTPQKYARTILTQPNLVVRSSTAAWQKH